MDDAYLGGVRSGGKRGRGAAGKTPFVAAVSTSPEGRPRKLKLAPVKGFRKREIARGAKHWLAPGAAVVTDGLGCWSVEDRARRGRCLLLAPVALIETPTRQHAMLPMAAAGADEAVRPAQPDQRRAALLLGAEGLPKRLVAQTTHARCNLEPHNRAPLMQNILRTYIPTGGVSRISRNLFAIGAREEWRAS